MLILKNDFILTKGQSRLSWGDVMTTFIQSGHERIGELLSRQRKYRVPFHQRDYAWTEDQVSQFWQDILGGMSDGGIEHFLGAIVFRQIEEDKDYEVIDGQQRLATSLIILAATRDIYYENNDDLWKEIQATYFGRKDRRTREVVPNFQMNSINDPVFQRYIANITARAKISEYSKKGTTKLTNRRLLNAYLYLRDVIEKKTSKVTEEFNPSFLIDLEDFMSKRLTTILVTVSDEADAFTLFETLNERGLELSILDLLKNHIFGKAKVKIESVKQNWTEMMVNLDEDVGVRFLRHYWVSKNGRVQAGRLFRDIREKANTQSKVFSLSEDLKSSAMIYTALSTADHSLWDDYSQNLRDCIRELRLLNAIQCYPVLLAAYEKFDDTNFERVARIMLVVAVRYSLICGFRTGALEIHYADIAHRISKGEIRKAGVTFRALRDIYPSDKTFHTHFKEKEIRTAKQGRYLLGELEVYKTGNQLEPTSDTDKINLEHIAPKNPNENWKDIGDTRGQDYENWAYRLGNQVLIDTRINKEIAGKAFEDKKKFLKKSPFSLTSSVVKYSQWTTKEIEERQVELADLAVKCWEYEL